LRAFAGDSTITSFFNSLATTRYLPNLYLGDLRIFSIR